MSIPSETIIASELLCVFATAAITEHYGLGT